MQTEMFKVFEEVEEIQEENVIWFDKKQKEMRTIRNQIQDFKWEPAMSDEQCIDMVLRIAFFIILYFS